MVGDQGALLQVQVSLAEDGAACAHGAATNKEITAICHAIAQGQPAQGERAGGVTSNRRKLFLVVSRAITIPWVMPLAVASMVRVLLWMKNAEGPNWVTCAGLPGQPLSVEPLAGGRQVVLPASPVVRQLVYWVKVMVWPSSDASNTMVSSPALCAAWLIAPRRVAQLPPLQSSEASVAGSAAVVTV